MKTEFKKVCKINKLITLKLEKNGWIEIFIEDELIAGMTKNPENLPPEVYFEKLCRKMKNWVNTNYDCTLIDVSIAFRLLEKLIEVGDRTVKIAMKREYLKKIKSIVHETDIKYIDELNYLLDAQFVKYFDSGELNKVLSNFNLPLFKIILRKLIHFEDYGEKRHSIWALNKIANFTPIVIDDYISENFLDSKYDILFCLVKEGILNKISIDNLFILFERPNSKIKEFLLLCLKNDDKNVRSNAAEILCKGNQIIINYIKNEVLKTGDHEKIIFLQNLLKSGYFVFINDDDLRHFLEDLNQNLLIELVNISIENLIQLLESKNYESRIIKENLILPSLKRIVSNSEDSIKKVFEENIVNLVNKEKFLMNFYLFSGGYLAYLRESEKLIYFSAISSKILDKFEKESNKIDRYEREILLKGFSNLGIDSIGLLFKLLSTKIMREWKKSLSDILIKIGDENRELIRKELFNLFLSLEYEELSDILYFGKLIDYLEKDDLIKLSDNIQAKLMQKIKLALEDDYESTAINLLIKMEEYGIETLLEWLKYANTEYFDSFILEFLKSLKKNVLIPLLQEALIDIIRSKDFKGLLNLIHHDLIKILSKEEILSIFWTEDKLITSLVDLLEKKSINSFTFSYPLRIICEVIGPEAENLLLRVFIHEVINDECEYSDERDFGPRIFNLMKKEIFEFERGKDTIIIGNKKMSSAIQGSVLLSTINVMNDTEKEKIIQNREILRQIFILYNNSGFPNKTPFDFFNNAQLRQIPLRCLAFSFFMEEDILGISSLLSIWGFSFNKLIDTLELEDWREIIEKPNFNFIELITKAMLLELDKSYSPNNFTNKWLVEYMGQVRGKLKEQIKVKIIDSFQQKNVHAILGIFSMDYHYYISEEEIIILIEGSIEACIKAQKIKKNDTLDFYIQRIHDIPKIGEIELQKLSEREKVIFQELKNSLLVSINDIKIENGKIIGLELKSRALNELPKYIMQLTYLEELNLSQNRLNSLPMSLGNIHSLRAIDLSRNFLVNLPESIGNLNSLNSLDLGHNKITALPESIGNITSLEELSLKGNKITNILELINNLPRSLRILDLSDNNLTSLPETINRLQSLLSLDLSSNNLASIPESIGDLTLLHSLDLSYNKINILPPSIGDLTSLKKINMGWNRIKNLPNTIGNLFNLKRLQINNNQISSLPESIGNLISLEEILLSNNKLSFLPKSIGNLPLLKYLSLQINKLSNLPKTICNIKSLKSLFLRCNGLTKLPEFLGNLHSLERLGLDTNQLKTLPESIGHLSSLKDLTLFHNPLKFLPESIENLTSLEISLDYTQSSTLKDIIKKLEKRGIRVLSL